MAISLTCLLGCVGCGDGDGRPDSEQAVRIAQQAMQDQRLQNERMAEQSKAIVQESQQLAEAAKELVTLDAESRLQLLKAQTKLQSELNQQQSSLDASRSHLEEERRQIAVARVRDPIVAESIQQVGLLLACLLPLAVCFVLLRHLGEHDSDDAALTELLVRELASDQPNLLAGPLPSEHHHQSMTFLNDSDTDQVGCGVETDWQGEVPDSSDQDPPPPF